MVNSHDSESQIIFEIMNAVKLSQQEKSHQKAYNTSRSYASDWRHFTDWCEKFGHNNYLPVDDQILTLYLMSMALNGYKTSTIKRRMSAICQAHVTSGFASPGTKMARSMLSGIRKAYNSIEVGKEPIDREMLNHLLAKLPDNIKGIRDKAILLIAHTGLINRSRLISIDIDQLLFVVDGVRIIFNDPLGGTIFVPSKSCNCPVDAMKSWIELSGISSGPVFRAINRHGQIAAARLSDRAIAKVVKEYVKAAGYDESIYSSSSLSKHAKNNNENK